MNPLDRTIAALFPGWALQRAKARHVLKAYEAADETRLRKPRRNNRSGNAAVKSDGRKLRQSARGLDEDHDLVVGVLDTFTANTVGAVGIQVEPQPRRTNGEIHAELAEQIQEARRDWLLKPEVTWQHDNAAMERLICLSWARDGEVFGQHLSGMIPTLDHGTRIPYSVELIEADLCPIIFDDASQGIEQGVEHNAWGRPRAYHFYLRHPGDISGFQFASLGATKRVAAANVQHVKLTRRIGQLRGITLLAPVLNRLQDLKEYEDAERIAAKIASAMAMYVQKGTPELFQDMSDSEEEDEAGRRLHQVAPGMMWVDLEAGEQVGTIDTSRPSNLLHPFRESMLRAVASGTRTGYSSIARSYDGTYSAQRQELVEQYMHYAAAQCHFVSQWTRPVYMRFLATAIAARQIRIPDDVDPLTIDDAEYLGPVMPWIDPAKEAQANLILVQAGFKSRTQVIRERGGNPQHVDNEILRERASTAERELVFSSDYANSAPNQMAIDFNDSEQMSGERDAA